MSKVGRVAIGLSRATIFCGICAALAVGLLLQSRNSPAQNQTGNWGPSVKGLACSIRTSKSTYAAGENIPLDFLLRGELEAPVQVMDPRTVFSFYGDALPLAITGPDGKHKYTGPVLTPPPPPNAGSFIGINQGEIRGIWASMRRPVQVIPKYWGINKPGNYSIKFTFRPRTEYSDHNGKMVQNKNAWSGELFSNTVAVTIK
jgi:hypothetical protein